MFKRRETLCITLYAWLTLQLGSPLTKVSAQTLSDEERIEQAQSLVLSARKAARRADHLESIRLFKKAHDLIPSPDNLFAIATIYERLEGRCKEALEAWERFLSSCHGCSLESKGQERFRKAISECRLELVIDSLPTGAEVKIDGELIGVTPLNTLAIAGHHRVSLNLEGHHPLQESIFLTKGLKSELLSFTLTAIKEPVVGAAPPSALSAAALAKPVPEPSQAVAWSLIGGGALAATLGAISLNAASNDVEALNSISDPKTLQTQLNNSNYQLKEGLGWAGLGLGVIGLGLGAYQLTF